MKWQSSAAVAGLFTLQLAVQAHAQVSAWQLSAAALRTDSTWQEFDDNGRRLLTENGILNGAELQASQRLGRWGMSLHLVQQQGSRSYLGETSLGQPVATAAAVQARTLDATAAYHFSPALSVALRLEHRRTDRVIASVGAATGYPEQFNWLMGSVGVQGQLYLPGSRMQGGVWWGQGTHANLQLNLPGRDPSILTLGRLTQSEVQLAWILPLGATANLRVNTGWQDTYLEQGQTAVVTRSGIPVAVARQPQTRITHRPMGVGLELQF